MIRESINRVQVQEEFVLDLNEKILGLTMLELMDPSDNLNEGVNDILGKFGLELEKKSPGVLGYMSQFATGVGKMVWLAIKKDKEGIKKLSQEFTREKFVDFLYKLDLVTLHLVTGPLHFIDGLTGWELGPKLKELAKGAEAVVANIRKALVTVKKEIQAYFSPKLQPLVLGKVADIEKLV